MGVDLLGHFSRNDYRHRQTIARNTLSTVMLIINKNGETTPMPPIREWLNKSWNIWTDINAVAKAAVEDLVAGRRAARWFQEINCY